MAGKNGSTRVHRYVAMRQLRKRKLPVKNGYG